MLPEWLAFSQQSRVATPEWRHRVTERITPSNSPRAIMVKATIYAQDSTPAHWREAQRLYSSVTPGLPKELVMLVQQWQHEIDLRLKLQQQSASTSDTPRASIKSQRIDALERENAELQQKLDELAHIEAVMSGRPLSAH